MFFDYENYEYYICPQSVDMRCGAHKLSQIVIAQMELDPLSKKMFLFTGKTRKSVKILTWDRNGWWLLYKKLYGRGSTFSWPKSEKAAMEITTTQISQFLSGEDCWRKFPELYGDLS